jgi:hypothetical protein
MNDNVYLDQNDIATNTDDSKETSMSYSRDQQAIAADAFLYIDKIMTASRASTHLSLAQSSSSSPSSSIQDISLAKMKSDDDKTHAMEEDHDHPQEEDQYSSTVYSNGENANKHSRKQRDNLRKSTKAWARAKAKKEKRNEIYQQNHYPIHPEEEETL